MTRLLAIVTLGLILASTWMAFTAGQVVPGPTEPAITFEKNIVYVHVPSAISTTVCFVALLVASIGYLATARPVFDHVGAASAEVALVFATAMNLTGSIFARPFWGFWWKPTPRLLSAAILWFLCVAYLILRANVQGQRLRSRLCAVFGIIAFLDVPMLFITARLMRDQHPQNISFGAPVQYASFGLAILGAVMLAFLLIALRTRILQTRTKLESQLTS